MKKKKQKVEVIVMKGPEREACSECILGEGLEVLAGEILEDMYIAFTEAGEERIFNTTAYKIRTLIDKGEVERALDLIYLLALLSDYPSKAKIEAFVCSSYKTKRCFADKFAEQIEDFYGSSLKEE